MLSLLIEVSVISSIEVLYRNNMKDGNRLVGFVRLSSYMNRLSSPSLRPHFFPIKIKTYESEWTYK